VFIYVKYEVSKHFYDYWGKLEIAGLSMRAAGQSRLTSYIACLATTSTTAGEFKSTCKSAADPCTGRAPTPGESDVIAASTQYRPGRKSRIDVVGDNRPTGGQCTQDMMTLYGAIIQLPPELLVSTAPAGYLSSTRHSRTIYHRR